MAAAPRARRAGFLAAALLLGALATLGAAEALVRATHPKPRMQVIRTTDPRLAFTEHRGVPLWHDTRGGGPTQGEDCTGAPTVVLAGDSILWVSPAHDRVRDLLQAALGEAACVVDVSQPGFVPWQQLAAVDALAERRPVDALIALVWKEDHRFARIGDALYDLDLLEVDALGTPRLPLAPDMPSVNRWLFLRSHLWAYATLTLARERPDRPRPSEAAYLELLDWADARHIPVGLVEAAPMHRPFSATLRERARERHEMLTRTPDVYGSLGTRLQREAERRGAPYLVVAEHLADEERATVAVDACCHLSPAGHARVAGLLEPMARELLARP